VPLLIDVQTGAPGFGRRGRLVLYNLTDSPPVLVDDETQPSIYLEIELDGLTLMGVDLDDRTIESGGRVHIVLYWRIDQRRRYQIETSLGDMFLETHEIGLGNLVRYEAEVGSVLHHTIVEDYWVVIPSTTSTGAHVLAVTVEGLENKTEVGILEIIDQEEATDRWLRIAGK
jgi:hypothetical protein